MNRIIAVEKELVAPELWSPSATCMDLKANEEIHIQPWQVRLVGLGIKTNFANKIYCRSSLPVKKGLILANSVWIIDDDYRWEIKVMLYNIKSYVVKIMPWERIAQMDFGTDIVDIKINKWLYDSFKEIYPTERWEWGFGSTKWYEEK